MANRVAILRKPQLTRVKKHQRLKKPLPKTIYWEKHFLDPFGLFIRNSKKSGTTIVHLYVHWLDLFEHHFAKTNRLISWSDEVRRSRTGPFCGLQPFVFPPFLFSFATWQYFTWWSLWKLGRQVWTHKPRSFLKTAYPEQGAANYLNHLLIFGIQPVL